MCISWNLLNHCFYFTEQGQLDLQLDNKLYHQIIEVFSSGFKNAPESL